MLQEVSSCQAAITRTDVEVTIDFIPRVHIGLISNVISAGGNAMSNSIAGIVVERIVLLREPEIEILRRECQSKMRTDGATDAIGLDVLPAEDVGDSKSVVRGRVNGVKGAMNACRRVAAAGGVVVLREYARLTPPRLLLIRNAVGSGPGANRFTALNSFFKHALNGVLERGMQLAFPSHSVRAQVLLAPGV